MKQGSPAIAELAKHLVKLFLRFMVNLNKYIFLTFPLGGHNTKSPYEVHGAIISHQSVNRSVLRDLKFTHVSTTDDCDSQILQPAMWTCFLWP